MRAARSVWQTWVGFSLQVAGELEGEGSILLVDLDLGLQAQHVVHGALGQAHGAGNGSAEDIFPGVSHPLWPSMVKAWMRLPSVTKEAFVIRR